MPLNPSILQNQLEQLNSNPPNTTQEAATRWANAIQVYTAGVFPPSTTGSAAGQVLEASLNTVSPELGNFIPIFTSGLTTFAATLGLGMAPLYIATPPPVPIIILPALNGTTASMGILVNIIDAWFRTGLAVMVLPTPPPPIPWV